MKIHFQNIGKDSAVFAFAGAAGIFLGFPNPVAHLPFMALLYPAALYLAGINAKSAKQAFVTGLLCGLAGSAAALYWMVVPAQNVAKMPLVTALICPLGVGLYTGAFGGLFCALAFALKKTPPWRHCIILGCLWYLLEFGRGFIFTGYPWLVTASAFAPWPVMIQGASVIGGYALGGVFALSACLLAGFRQSISRALCGLAVLAILAVLGWQRIEHYDQASKAEEASAQKIKAAFIEGNVDQNQKWNHASQRRILDLHLRLTREALDNERPDLVIWPETAMPFLFQNHPVFPEIIRSFAREHKIWLLFGAPGYMEKKSGGHYFFNKAYLINPRGETAGEYEKEHLVPFGEYLPFWLDFDFTRGFLQGLGNFKSGSKVSPLRMNGLALGVLICYETIFPELAQKRVADGANILVNISNDQWFGLTSAPTQHLQLASLRAVEQRRWILRGTSSGISGVYDPMGRLVSHGGQLRAEVVYGVAGIEKGFTIFHNIFAFLPYMALALAAGLLFLRKK